MKTTLIKKTIPAMGAISKECNNSNLQYKTHLCYHHISHQMSPKHSKIALSILTSAMSIIIITIITETKKLLKLLQGLLKRMESL